ncbi:1-acyl-sn-glycerol-3-phosphate acyltransferase, partial [Staphylococcus aureus]|nr:1-acyl-sn-glycerol-3-phosphate acyltransferase [Staphylococcus aureus]
PILPAAYIGPKKIQGLITGKSIIKFGEPIDTKNLPKDMKRNEKLEYLTKELEKRTIQLQNELNASVAHK